MLLERLARAATRFLDRVDRTNATHRRHLAGTNHNLVATNEARHHLYASRTGEARRIAALKYAEAHPFNHAAERRSRHHRR